MYAKPDPKKVKFQERKQRVERERVQQIESCHRQHRTGQQRYKLAQERREAELQASLAAELGLDVSMTVLS